MIEETYWTYSTEDADYVRFSIGNWYRWYGMSLEYVSNYEWLDELFAKELNDRLQ